MAVFRAPFSVQYELTYRCNHHCGHCFNHVRDAGTYHVDACPELDWDGTVRVLQQLIDNGIFTVVLTGGEPLLRRDLVLKCIEFLAPHGIRVTLNTNATLITPEFLSRAKEAGLEALLVSCPSMTADLYNQMVGTSNFSRFILGMRSIADSGIGFSINMVVNQFNLNNIKATAQAVHEQFNCNSFSATPMSLNACFTEHQLGFLTADQVTNLVSQLVAIGEQLHIQTDVFESLVSCVIHEDIRRRNLGLTRRFCTAGRTVMAIGPDGQARPCGHAPMTYGNLSSESLVDIWQRMEPWRTNAYVPKACLACTYFNHCKGGCRISALANTGQLTAPDPWMQQPLVEPLIQKKSKTITNDHQSYRIVEPIRWREETPGTFLVCSRTTNTLIHVNTTFYKFIMGLRDVSTFTVHMLVTQYEYERDEVIRLLGALLTKSIVAPV